jgi:hypothetical protein
MEGTAKAVPALPANSLCALSSTLVIPINKPITTISSRLSIDLLIQKPRLQAAMLRLYSWDRGGGVQRNGGILVCMEPRKWLVLCAGPFSNGGELYKYGVTLLLLGWITNSSF